MIKTVEDLTLIVDGGLRTVNVLAGLFLFGMGNILKCSRSESDHLALRIPNGKHESFAEPIEHLPFTRDQESRLYRVRFLKF